MDVSPTGKPPLGPDPAVPPAQMVELTIRTAGAVPRAPRVLRAWMTVTETCVRDDAGMLLWLATPAETAWVHDGQLVSASTRDDDDAEGLLREPAPEVAALRSIHDATSWLGANHGGLRAGDDTRLFGREVDWFELTHPRLRNLRIARDAATGIILHVSGSDPRHGDLLVEVTSLAVLPHDPARFRSQLQL